MTNEKSLPVTVDTVCNHIADSYSHTLLQSGHSPRRSNTQDMPAAVLVVLLIVVSVS